MTELSGTNVLVVGATGVLGAELARQLAAQGAQLTLSGRSEEKLSVLAGELGEAVVGQVAADLGKPTGPADIAAAVYGRELHGVVFASGVVAFGPAVEVDDDTLDELMLVNLLGYMRLMREVAPKLGKDSFIAQISAVVAESPTAGMAAYSATKAGLSAYGKALTLELRRQGVRVLDARPPHTETGLATRPIAGEAPKLPQGKDPRSVAGRIITAIVEGERDLPSSAF
ncbi:SDR family NAD(P)-dependent oxidoreductase [Arthrobacter bussei]|uniref:SDR family NAD(P)-dependent oxidoreductase n=1 Tax=Arthrobacter bussei TaxID=2594179 RepID=A0A7X1NNU0_9MICC|nr:SDR family NAD(P)-dependent oxidoreductase [Arthrobacter bussei]MPY10157.1 SDR family NAD(P)-dependent oxidoreductase [Arthrobacter bussei]